MADADIAQTGLAQAVTRFPEAAATLRRLALTDPEFREICEEYALAQASLAGFEARLDAAERTGSGTQRRQRHPAEPSRVPRLATGDGAGSTDRAGERSSDKAAGMRPKVEAAQEFASATGGRAIICALADVPAALGGRKGTTIAANPGPDRGGRDGIGFY